MKIGEPNSDEMYTSFLKVVSFFAGYKGSFYFTGNSGYRSSKIVVAEPETSPSGSPTVRIALQEP